MDFISGTLYNFHLKAATTTIVNEDRLKVVAINLAADENDCRNFVWSNIENRGDTRRIGVAGVLN